MMDTNDWGRDRRFPDGSGAGSAMMERLIERRQFAAQMPAAMPRHAMAGLVVARPAPTKPDAGKIANVRRLAAPEWPVNFDVLLDVASFTFQVTREQLLGHSRAAPFPRARQGLIWVTRQVTDWSQPTIGRRLNRDHSTINHNTARARALRETDRRFRLQTDVMLKVLEEYCAERVGMEAEHAG